MILVVGVGGIYHIKRVYRNGNRIYDTNLKSVDYLKTLNINVRQIDQRVLSMLQGLGNMTVAEYRAEIEKLQDSNAIIMEKYLAMYVANGESLETYNDIRRMKALRKTL